MTTETCTIDDCGPYPVRQPTSIEELGEMIREADQQGQAVFPLGGRTMLDFGAPPSREGIAIETTKLNQILDFPARDMTVTVQSGITLSTLQQSLEAENLRLPIDIPLPDQATLGGAIATNTSGPRRYGFGTLRDYVIGISVVNDEGIETKAGGRVVKNVAGYDLCKLHTGAMGTLGIISQVTLKLRPLVEQSTLMVLGCESSKLESLLDVLHRSRARPVCLDLLNRRACESLALEGDSPLPESEWNLIVGLEESATAVQWQMKHLIEELAQVGHRGIDTRVGVTTSSLWNALRDFRLTPTASFSFKMNVLPSAVASLCGRIQERAEEVMIQSHAGNGMIEGHMREVNLEQAKTLHAFLSSEASEAQGNVVILRCPAEWKKELSVWGNPRADAFLMQSVKEKLDPKQIFNPGRLLSTS